MNLKQNDVNCKPIAIHIIYIITHNQIQQDGTVL